MKTTLAFSLLALLPAQSQESPQAAAADAPNQPAAAGRPASATTVNSGGQVATIPNAAAAESSTSESNKAPSPDAYMASFGEAIKARPARAAAYLTQAIGEYPAWTTALLKQALTSTEATAESSYDLVFAAVQEHPTGAADLVEAARATRPDHAEVIERAARDAMGEKEEEALVAQSEGKDLSKSPAEQNTYSDKSKGGKEPIPTAPVIVSGFVPVYPFRDPYQPTVFRPFFFGGPPPEECEGKPMTH